MLLTEDPALVVLEHDQASYSPRFVAFVRHPLHAEAYRAAYLDQSSSSRNELERLRREYQTLPPRHLCSCRCPNEQRGWLACTECKRLRQSSVQQDLGVEIGHTARAEAATPMILLLDLERALAILGDNASATRVALWLSEGE